MENASSRASARSSVNSPNYLNAEYSVKSWLLTEDHKRIAILYLISMTAYFFLGGLIAYLRTLGEDTTGGDPASDAPEETEPGKEPR